MGLMTKFYPTMSGGKAFSIEMHHKNVEEAGCGDNVGVNVKGLDKDKMPRVGDVMCIDDKKMDPNPPKSAKAFTALVFVQDHPGKLNHAKLEKQKPKAKGGKGAKTTDLVEVYKGGFTPSIHIRTAKAPCQMVDIKWKMGKSTNNQKVEGPMYIEAGDQAEVVFHPKLRLVVSPFDECKPLDM